METVDILKTISFKYDKIFTVGFVAETDNLIENATSKLVNKKLNMIIANDGIMTLDRDTKRNIGKVIIKIIYDSYLKYLKDNDAK